jgi:hypothetical protein
VVECVVNVVGKTLVLPGWKIGQFFYFIFGVLSGLAEGRWIFADKDKQPQKLKYRDLSTALLTMGL